MTGPSGVTGTHLSPKLGFAPTGPAKQCVCLGPSQDCKTVKHLFYQVKIKEIINTNCGSSKLENYTSRKDSRRKRKAKERYNN